MKIKQTAGRTSLGNFAPKFAALNDAFCSARFGRGTGSPPKTRSMLTDPKKTVFLANVTFESRCRNNWHIHHATSGGGRVNAETFALSKEYFFYITLGIPFYLFGQAMNPVIRADGSPKFAMASTLAGAVANIILDPIFIFVFRWGMMGAAVATVIGQVLTAAPAVLYRGIAGHFELLCR